MPIENRWRWEKARSLYLSLAVVAALAAARATGESVDISASKDNTLYEEDGKSNGAGQHFFVGRTGHETRRRGLIAFDIAASIPAGSTIQSATLTLHASMNGAGSPAAMVEVHRATADWGEGSSAASGAEGAGAPATPGDATWSNSFYPNDFWVTPGGEYLSTVGAAANVSDPGFYTWGSTAGLVASVQLWLDSPSTNFGWVLIAQNESARNAKRFDTRENDTPSFRPLLQVTYALAAGDGGTNDGGAPDGGPDSGPPDAGSADAGLLDGGADAGLIDGGGTDAGPALDAGMKGGGGGCSQSGSSLLFPAVVFGFGVALLARRWLSRARRT